MAIEHSDIPDGERHEPKGISAAAAGTVYIADGAASGAWTDPLIPSMGWWDYNDLATQSSPITLSAPDTILTNDGLGAFTGKSYALTGVADIWDASTNRFDFTGLDLGDTVDIRFDVEVTTAGVNSEILVDMELGLGASPYTLRVDTSAFKTAGIHQITVYYGLYIGDANTRDNPAQVMMTSDNTSDTVKVNGWYVRALKRS